MKHQRLSQDRGAAILEYVLATSVLFFVTVGLVTTVDSMARGYLQAATATSGSPIDDSGTPQPGAGFAPCGRHSTLGRTDLGGDSEECY